MFAPAVVNEVSCVSFFVRLSLSEMNFEFRLFSSFVLTFGFFIHYHSSFFLLCLNFSYSVLLVIIRMFAPVVVNEVSCVSFVVRVSLFEMNFESVRIYKSSSNHHLSSSSNLLVAYIFNDVKLLFYIHFPFYLNKHKMFVKNLQILVIRYLLWLFGNFRTYKNVGKLSQHNQ